MDKKRAKFVELGEKRVKRVLKDMRLVGNLANKKNYSYDDGDVKKIISAIDRELKSLRRKFDDEAGNDDTDFTFN